MLPNEPYKGAQPFYALEVIRLHSVRFSQSTFGRLMALCPCLHTLDLRRCDCRDVLSGAGAFIPPAGENLRRITVAMCHAWETRLDTLAEKKMEWTPGPWEPPCDPISDSRHLLTNQIQL